MVMPKTRTGTLAPAVTLFFFAPFIAEFLLGDLPLTMLPALIVLAPMYGGGALLIRELVRRTGRGWPSILLLAICYGVVEEAFTTQSLFNPDYLHLHLGLLKPAYIGALGIGGWWTLFVVTLHAGWSICCSIAVVECLRPGKAKSPWLGRSGLAITAILFVGGAVIATNIGLRQDHFTASRAQFASAAAVCVLLAAAALLVPSTLPTSVQPSFTPKPFIVGLTTLLAGSAVLLTPNTWAWGAVALTAALDGGVIALLWVWSRSPAWSMREQLAAAAGAALAYGWHAFLQTPAVNAGSIVAVRVGNGLFLAFAVAFISFASP